MRSPESVAVPLVTVVTVCYNDFPRLPETVASVAEQSLAGGLEHLIVDGGSADETPTWGPSWASDAENRRFVSESDKGIFDAMNKGARLARGRYIAFLNAGDSYASPSALDTAVSNLSAADSNWGYGRARIVDSSRRSVRPEVGAMPYSRRKHLLGFATICHQAVVMKRSFLLSLRGFDHERFEAASDYALLLRAAEREGPVTWPDVMVNYEIGGVSETDVYRQLWRRHLARVGTSKALPRPLDALWTAGQCARVASGRLARRILPLLGIATWRGRDLRALND